ncbi:MAG: hypothetical protein HC810_00860 [Acaryochloridaceae cyanobacterium RL_2_7]|nr:hypothetical protein [Acaryochloridaceae cyanobacterium RL_2_7]
MGRDALEQVMDSALPFSQWRIANRLWNRLTLNPTLQIEQADLDKIEINNLPDSGIIAIASAKGTGKTKFISKQVKHSDKALLASHRIALSRHLCHRLGLDYRGDIDKVSGEFINGSSYTLRIGFCVDSLLAIDPDQFTGCDLVIDEVCQVLRHLLTSSTCNKDGRRPALLARLRQIIQQAKRVVVADADLDDASLLYLKQLRGEEQSIFLLKNNHKAEGYPCTFIQSRDRTPIIEDLIKALKTQAEDKVFYVTTDSKSLSKTLFELIHQVYPDKRTLVINAETSGGEFEQAFIQNPDEVLGEGDYDVIICSPSVSTGTSIESQDIIQAVYGIFMGVSLNDADISQSLSRVREAVPRVIWCASRGRNYCKVSKSTNPIELKGHLFERTTVTTSLIRSSLKQDSINILESYNWQLDPHIHLFAKISADQNWAMANLREAVQVRLQIEGNFVTVLNVPVNSTLRNLMRETRAMQKLTQATAILEADDLNVVEVKALDEKEGLSLEESLALTKAHLKDFYHVPELSLELIQFDRDGRGRGEILNLEAQLSKDLAIDRTAKALEKQASWRQDLCPWDIPGTAMRRELRDKLGLNEFIREAIAGREWIADDLESLAQILRSHAVIIKHHLGFTLSDKMTDTQVVHQLLSQLGLKFSFHWSNFYPGHEGKKMRVYSLDSDHWIFLETVLARREKIRDSKPEDDDCTDGSPHRFNDRQHRGDHLPLSPENLLDASLEGLIPNLETVSNESIILRNDPLHEISSST